MLEKILKLLSAGAFLFSSGCTANSMTSSFNLSGKYGALANFMDYKENGVKLFSKDKLKNGRNK